MPFLSPVSQELTLSSLIDNKNSLKVDTSTLDNKQKFTFHQINSKYISSQQPVNLNTKMLQNIQTLVFAFVGSLPLVLT